MSVHTQIQLTCENSLQAEGVHITSNVPEHCFKIGLLNLMPVKPVAERQIARLLGLSAHSIELVLLKLTTHHSKSTQQDHLNKYYKEATADQLNQLDGLIVTGAPIELLPYEEVDFWKEFSEILDHIRSQRISAFHICWAAQAALYHSHGVRKKILKEKAFGIFEQEILDSCSPLMHEMPEKFLTPVSRHSDIWVSDLLLNCDLELVAGSSETGVALVFEETSNTAYMFNHLEYENDTLSAEFNRDKAKGLNPAEPHNNHLIRATNGPKLPVWQSHARQIYENWLDQVLHRKSKVPGRASSTTVQTSNF